MTPTCSPAQNDDEKSKENEGVTKEVGVGNVPNGGTTPQDT